MHILEQYALACGVKIDKPQIHEAFFPLSEEVYITFHSHGKFDSRNYNFLQEVINLIKEPLATEGISLIQLGVPEDPPLRDVKDLRGRCTLTQSAYVLQKSLLHFGVDSFLIHLAGHYNLPTVALYSNMYKEQSKPYWGDPSRQILIESPKPNTKPSYAPVETPKTINLIRPEKIAHAILGRLNIANNLHKMETLHMGQNYHTPVLDVMPDHVPTGPLFRGSKVHLRLDYQFNEEVIAGWCGHDRQLLLLTKNELTLPLLRKLKPSVAHIAYEIDHNANPAYITQLQALGIPVTLLTKTADPEELTSLRLKFIDWIIENPVLPVKKDLDNDSPIDYNSALYKSSKSLISKGQEFSSYAAWLQEIPKTTQAAVPILDRAEFWNELDYFRIIKT